MEDDFIPTPTHSWISPCIILYDVLLSKLLDGLNDKNASGLNCVNTSSAPGDHSELRCADGFFVDNSSSSSPLCIPLCKSWLTVGTEEVALALCLVLSIISSIIFLIVTGLQKDTMYVRLAHKMSLL